jgi:hypothetical protein
MITTTQTQTIPKLQINFDYGDCHAFNQNLNKTLFICNGDRNSIDSIYEAKQMLSENLSKKNRRLAPLLQKYDPAGYMSIISEIKEYYGYTRAEAVKNLDIMSDEIGEMFYDEHQKLFDFISFCFNSIGLQSETYSSRGYSQGDYVYCLTLERHGGLIDQDYVSNILWDSPMTFVLLDDEGDQIDSCGGFWDYESMKDYLPSEFANENLEDYLKHSCLC